MDRKRYSAFTLIEMLVVMIILIVIGSLSYAAYQDMQTTIRLNEYASVLEENIRRVQREAMLLKREPGEGWIYGLGIDFSNAEKEGEYKVFKWCAEGMDYGGPETTSDIPGYDFSKPYGDTNGVLPSRLSPNSSCKGVPRRIELKGYDIGLKPPKATIGLSSNKAVMDLTPGYEPYIHYILFESVTGRAFYYSNSSQLIGYKPDKGGFPVLVEGGVKPFEMTIIPLTSGRSARKKVISIDMFSGKVTVRAGATGLETPPPKGEEKPLPVEEKPPPGYGIDPIKDPILNL